MCVCKLCFILYFSGWRKTSWATLVFGKITFLQFLDSNQHGDVQ